MLDESEAKAQALVSDAEATARRIAEGERRRLESRDPRARRRGASSCAPTPTRSSEFAPGYRDRIRAAIEADLANLGGEVEPPSARPSCTTSSCRAERDAAPVAAARGRRRARRAERAGAATALADPSSRGTPARPTPSARSTAGVGSSASEPSRSRPSAVRRVAGRRAAASRPPAAEWPPPAPAPEAVGRPPRRRRSRRGWRPTTTGRAGEPAWDAPAPWERDTAQHEAFSSRRADGGHRHRHRLARRRRVLRVAARGGARRRAARPARRRAGRVLRRATTEQDRRRFRRRR